MPRKSIPLPKLAFAGGEIRRWRAADAESLFPLADNRKIWLNLRDGFPSPYTRRDARRWVTEASAPASTHFAVEVEDRDRAHNDRGRRVLAGGIGLILGQDIHIQSGEIGYWLGEPYWGRGIMTEAVKAFSAFALPRFGLCRLHARVLEGNAASMRVLEKAGYAQEARLRKSALKEGRVLDEFLYSLVI